VGNGWSAHSISSEDALARVQAALGDRIVEAGLNHDQVDITCAPEGVVEVMEILRDADELRCRFFTFLSGVDRSAAAGRDEGGNGDGRGPRSGLEVLIHVYSPDNVFHVNVHVPVDVQTPECPSISAVYAGAIWHERETWEMFGIDFPGHPRLVNLYLPEDFEGHPLLKSFKLPSRSVKEWPGAKDPEEAAAGGR
jgi:NADH-quinone oxidoreductase subunit C